MKKRRDITLGEMQDECNRNDQSEQDLCNPCKYFAVCPFAQKTTPSNINLTDTPRFNEAQMALLKAFKGVGAERVRATVYGDSIRTFDLIDRFGNGMSFNAILGIGRDETLDLAELLGKDGKE